MVLSKEQFEINARKCLKKQASLERISLDDVLAGQVIQALTHIFERYAQKVASDETLHRVIEGVVRWTPEREDVIAQLSQEMSAAFQPIINPDEPIYEGVLWSGQAKKRALEKSQKGEGCALESTLWGRFLEEITPDMNDCFFPGAFTPGHDPQTAGSLLIWDGTSRTFAQKMKGDVEVTLLEADTRAQSVFFNTELPRLRALQETGVVGKIYLSSLTESAKQAYNTLIDEKQRLIEAADDTDVLSDTAKKESLQSLEKINAKLSTLIKDKENWERVALDKKSPLKLVTGGKHSEKGSVRFSKMIGLGDKWMGKIKTLGEAIDPLLDRIKYYKARQVQIDSFKILGEGQFLLQGHAKPLQPRPSHPKKPSQKNQETLSTQEELKENKEGTKRFSSPASGTSKNRYGYFRQSDPTDDSRKKEINAQDDLSIKGKGAKR